MINVNAYPDKYRFYRSNGVTGDHAESEIKISNSFATLVNDGNIVYGDPIDNSNCYTGFDPSINNFYVGNALVSSTTFKPTVFQWQNDCRKINNKINYRLCARINDSTQKATTNMSAVVWNCDSTTKGLFLQYHNETNNYIPYYDCHVIDNNYNYHNNSICPNSQESFMYGTYPITSINIHDLIFLPVFYFERYTYVFDDETGYIKSANLSSSTRPFIDVKAEDDLPQGAYYDDDLYTRGYRHVYDDTTGKIIATEYCKGVLLRPYFGYCKYTYNNGAYTNVEGNQRVTTYSVTNWTYPTRENTAQTSTTSYRYMTPCVIAEQYDSKSGKLIYSGIDGVVFGNDINRVFYHGMFSPDDTFNVLTSWGAESEIFYSVGKGFSKFMPPINAGQCILDTMDGESICNFVSIGKNTTDDFDISSHAFTQNVVFNSQEYMVRTNIQYTYPFFSGKYFSVDELIKIIASLGLYIAGNELAAKCADIYNVDSPYVYLGNMTDDGTTDGTLIQGIAVNDLPQSDWGDPLTDTPYTPVSPYPQSDDGEDDTRKRNDETNLPSFDGIRLVSGTGFSSFYLLSSYHVSELGQLLSSMPQNFWESLGTSTDYKMSNILDYIVALKWYPVDIHATAPTNFPDVQTSDLQFGFNGVTKVTFTAPGTSFKLGTVNRVYNMGSVPVPYRSGTQTFLDLEPYTDVYINLPYIGKVQLQSNQVLGYTISVHYVIDLITGMCTCLVDNGYDTLYTGSGKMGVDVSVTGNDIITQSERMTSAYLGTVTHAISNSLSLGGAVSSEDVAGTVSGYSGMISGLVSDCISTANAKRGVPQVVGGGSGFGSTYAAQNPCIIVQRPAVKIPADYGHSVGYVYNSHTAIGSVSGFTICDNPDLSGIPATTAELDMIRSILTSGFYA